MAGRLADEIWQDFEIIKILYWLEFYFVDISAMLLIVLEMHFSLLFSNKTGIVYIRVCFLVHKIWSSFFSCRSLLFGNSIPNDNCAYIEYIIIFLIVRNTMASQNNQ